MFVLDVIHPNIQSEPLTESLSWEKVALSCQGSPPGEFRTLDPFLKLEESQFSPVALYTLRSNI